MAQRFDVVVMGLGGVGSSAAFHLARRGLNVLGVEQFGEAHDLGSSHGHTRIIRQAYFEHANYVPMLLRSYELWGELESLSGKQLYRQTGLLEIGPPDGVVCPGVISAAGQHHLAIEILSRSELQKRWPAFVVPDGYQAVYEQESGYLFVEDCVAAHCQQARQAGAHLRWETHVSQWEASASGVRVQFANGDEVEAANLVITTGAWARPLLQSLGVECEVVRKHLHWFHNEDSRYDVDNGCPVFFYENDKGYFYGFPQCDERGVKVAEHSGGDAVVDPSTVNRDVDLLDLERVKEFLGDYLPGVSQRPTDRVVCMYTRTPDEHFVVDTHPEYPHVCLVAGLSGHGFKFTTALGETLADLVERQSTDAKVDFLRIGRFK